MPSRSGRPPMSPARVMGNAAVVVITEVVMVVMVVMVVTVVEWPSRWKNCR